MVVAFVATHRIGAKHILDHRPSLQTYANWDPTPWVLFHVVEQLAPCPWRCPFSRRRGPPQTPGRSLQGAACTCGSLVRRACLPAIPLTPLRLWSWEILHRMAKAVPLKLVPYKRNSWRPCFFNIGRCRSVQSPHQGMALQRHWDTLIIRSSHFRRGGQPPRRGTLHACRVGRRPGRASAATRSPSTPCKPCGSSPRWQLHAHLLLRRVPGKPDTPAGRSSPGTPASSENPLKCVP